MKYDLVSRIMDHSTKSQVIVERDIKKMNQGIMEKRAQRRPLFTNKWKCQRPERTACEGSKKEVASTKAESRSGNTAQSNSGLTEDFLLLSSVINTIIESS